MLEINTSVNSEQLSGIASFINIAKSDVTLRLCIVLSIADKSLSAASVHPK